MCFTATKKEFNHAMAKVRAIAKQGYDKLVVYKVLEIDESDHTIYSPYYCNFLWKVGVNKTEADKVEWVVERAYYGDKKQRTNLYRGFHAFRNKKEATDICTNTRSKVVVELEVNIKDIVAANETEIVFTKCILYPYAERHTLVNLEQL